MSDEIIKEEIKEEEKEEKEIIKEEKELKEKKEKKLKKLKNNGDFVANNISLKGQLQKVVSFPSGQRSKIIESITYKNGVVKNKCIGIVKDGKLIKDFGVDKKKFGLK